MRLNCHLYLTVLLYYLFVSFAIILYRFVLFCNIEQNLGGAFIFYSQFEKLCNQNHIKPSALARKLGFSPSAPGRWKSGAIPQGDTLQRLSEYFGVTTDYLLYGDERPNNSVGYDSNSPVV